MLVRPRWGDDQFQVDIETLPGRSYEILRRLSLNDAGAAVADEIEGDGYIQTVSIPAPGDGAFLELRR